MRFNVKLLVFFALIPFFALGQSIPSVIPPSPKTQEFNKYLNYNVSIYNGLPEITIPLYNIQVRGVSIPINLSYHASGIKMRQENGDVGVGWSLNPGYRVSRTVNGFADERQVMPSSFDSVSYYSYDLAKKDRYLSRFMYNQFDRPYNSGSDLLDGEYDMFNFSLPIESGSFIITDRANKTVTTIDSSSVKIDYSTTASSVSSVSGITGFKLTDASGINYYAGEYLSAANNWVFESNSMYGGYLGTAWAITDIVTPLGEQVHFKYNLATSGGWMPNQKSFTFSERVPIDNNSDIESNAGEVTNGEDNTYTTFLMGEITSANEKITFNRNNINRVTSIDISTTANVTIKKIKFYYSDNALHFFLDSLQVLDAVNKIVETYKFDYYNKTANPLDMVHDQWGYYQTYFGTSPYTHLFHQEFFDDRFFTDNSFYTQPISSVFYEPAPRAQVIEAPISFSLKKIIYPTGGSTLYEYESNRFTNISNEVLQGGGLRIKQVSHFSSDSYIASTRNYVYGKDENGYGNAQIQVNPNLFVNETVRLRAVANHSGLWPQRVVTYSTHMRGDLDPQGYVSSYVVYPEVTEYYGENNTFNPVVNSGKIVYRYDMGLRYLAGQLSASGAYVIPNSQYRSYSPFYVHYYRTWDRPLLREKLTYSLNSATGFKLVQKDTLSYVQKQPWEFTGLKVRPFASSDQYSPSSIEYYNHIPSFFDYGTYIINCSRYYLSGKREITYSSNDSLTVVSSYEYNKLNLIRSERNIGSNGNLNEKIFSYPKEMVDSNRDPNGVYQAMVAQNIISPLVENKLLINNIQRSLTRNNYINPYVGVYVPGSVQTQQEITDALETRLVYHDYDNKGNILSVSQEQGPKTSYIWSYNREYPVAKIENASYNMIETVLGGSSVLDAFESSTSPNVHSFLAPLRTDTLLKNAMITTYTYQPLLGITSMVDPKGKITFYEYDSYGRLKNIKDQNGNIVKSYTYNLALR